MAVDKPERLMKAISIEHFSPRQRSLIYALEQENYIGSWKLWGVNCSTLSIPYQKRVTLPIFALQRIEVTLDTGHRCGLSDSNALLFRGVGILVHGVGGCFRLISRISLVWTFVWHWLILDPDSVLPRSSQLWSLSWIPNDKCMTEVWCQTSCYTLIPLMNNCNMSYYDLTCYTIR